MKSEGAIFIVSTTVGLVLGWWIHSFINSNSCDLQDKKQACYHKPTDTLYTIKKKVYL